MSYVQASSPCSHPSYYHDVWGCCSVYFLPISTAHFHLFMARSLGIQLVVCIHSTPALFTMVQSLSRHLKLPPKTFQCLIFSRTPRRGPPSNFVDLTAGIVKHQLSIIPQADH